jgi:hypothetical protein
VLRVGRTTAGFARSRPDPAVTVRPLLFRKGTRSCAIDHVAVVETLVFSVPLNKLL